MKTDRQRVRAVVARYSISNEWWRKHPKTELVMLVGRLLFFLVVVIVTFGYVGTVVVEAFR